jgi:thiamine biosynthesis lipoprotein
MAAVVHRFERRAMGSPLRLTVVDPASAIDPPTPPGAGARVSTAEAAWALVSDEFEAAEQAMSRFRDTSDLSAVNRSAGSGWPIAVDRRLIRALVASDRAGRITEGRFDARVLTDLERLGYRGADLATNGDDDAPDPAAADRSDPAGHDRRWMCVDPRRHTVALDVPVDTGGIGKGLGLRWAWRALERGGLLATGAGALLEAGGDLVACGPSPDLGPWLVGVEDPLGRQEHLAVIGVERGAVTTSSVAIHRWATSDGRTVHHLIDPRTGEPGGDGLLAVTVAGPDPAWSEVWSKSLFLAGARAIAGLARGRGLAAWWVREDGDLEMTPAARARTTWVSGED